MKSQGKNCKQDMQFGASGNSFCSNYLGTPRKGKERGWWVIMKTAQQSPLGKTHSWVLSPPLLCTVSWLLLDLCGSCLIAVQSCCFGMPWYRFWLQDNFYFMMCQWLPYSATEMWYFILNICSSLVTFIWIFCR